MKTLLCLLFSLWVTISANAEAVSFVTLNCYWFMGEERYANGDSPRDKTEYSLKAGHLVGLLPDEAPLFLGLQEIGNNGDVEALAKAASERYKHKYVSLFTQGKDTATKQDVGGLLDATRGWGIFGQASRVSDLEKELSKHLVVRLTNKVATVDVCVVHLRRPIGAEGENKQREQNQALLRWSMRHLAKNPQANLVIMGDFNEGKPVGSNEQTLAVLFQAKPPLIDSFSALGAKPKSHADGKAYDRILISDGLFNGLGGLKFEKVEIRSHSHGKGENRRLYTDHFPVILHLQSQTLK